MFKNYKRHGYLNADKIRVDQFRNECNLAVQVAKGKYLITLGLNITDPNTSQKSYCKVVTKLLNKCKVPKIPPIFINNQFIVNCKLKAAAFNNVFAAQCNVITNNSTVP